MNQKVYKPGRPQDIVTIMGKPGLTGIENRKQYRKEWKNPKHRLRKTYQDIKYIKQTPHLDALKRLLMKDYKKLLPNLEVDALELQLQEQEERINEYELEAQDQVMEIFRIMRGKEQKKQRIKKRIELLKERNNKRAIRRAKGEASEEESVKDQLFDTEDEDFDSDAADEQSNDANSDKANHDIDQNESENDD